MLARAIYASATPFSMVENPHWKNFFHAIRPSYVVPSRYKITEPLLDSEYDKIHIETLAAVGASDSAGLMCDGWSNIRNEAIINFVVSLPKSIFWNSFHTKLQSHLGEYIADEVLKVIEEIKRECGKMVIGVVTNNASNMKKAWRLIEEKFPATTCYRCAAHGLNLIFCNIMKLETCKKMMEQAKDVIKDFKHKHMLVDMLKAMQKGENVNCTLKLPVKTRWGSTITSFESVQKNKLVLHKIAVSEQPEKGNLSEQVRRTLLDDTFWHENKAIVTLLKPLQSAITLLKGDAPNLADVCGLFFKIRNEILGNIDLVSFSSSEQEEIKSILDAREDFCIKIIHKAAYFLDPREQGHLLNDDDKVAAMEFICGLAEKLSSSNMLNVNASQFPKSAHFIPRKKDFTRSRFYGIMSLPFPQLPGGMGIAVAKSCIK